MVQLHDQDGLRACGSNEYWKLDSGAALSKCSLLERLSNKKFTTPKEIYRSRLDNLYVRCQRGLLSYEGLPLRELRKFAAQRALPIDNKATLNSIKALKGLLEKADDDITFDRLSELPPELRQIILLHYFDSLVVREARHKQQPPVTRVSRKLREESLPLHYECCEFAIDAVDDPRTKPGRRVPQLQAAPFVQNTTIENFARIKALTLLFHDLGAHVQLDLRDKDNPVVSAWVLWFISGSYTDGAVRVGKQRLISELRALAMSIVAREGPLELRLSDLEEMREILRRHSDPATRQDLR